MSIRGATAMAAVCLAATSGLACGDDEDSAGTTVRNVSESVRLAGADREVLRESEASIVDYCRRRALALTDPSKRPTANQQARAFDAVDTLIGLASVSPDAEVMPGVDVSLFLSDLTENLEGSNCDPQILARLEAGLRSVP